LLIFAEQDSLNMANINEHIGAMLIERDCVIVKGLGAFVASRVPAAFDKKRGVMTPPRKEIVFNKSLSHNDGMLAGYISMQEGVTVDVALVMIDEYVARVRKLLQINGHYELEGVGVLRSIGGEISFAEDKNNALLSDSYGFAPLRVEEQRVGISHIVRSHTMRRVATTAAVLACLLLVSPDMRDSEVSNRDILFSGYSDLFVQSSLGAERTVVADEVVESAVSADMSAPASADETLESEGEELALASKHYYIIVGSFGSNADADKYISDMRRKGVEGLTKMKAVGRKVRVTAGEFADHAEAQEKNRQLRRVGGFEKAWVLTVEQ
jgi:hypothetical protein